MEFKDGQILDTTQLKQLKTEGHDLDDKKLHVIRFLFNDKWNRATQPGPFRIKTEILDKLAKDAIGSAWLVLPNSDLHPVDATPEQLVNLTKEYAVGQIKSTIKYPSNNVWGIIEIFPKYEDMVQKDELPPLVSPLFNVIKEDADGISDAQFLNLQSVKRSGYPAQLTRITSFCKNGLKECIAELSLAGASGNSSKADPKRFSIMVNGLGKTMAAQGENQVTLESVAKTVEDHGKAITQLSENVRQIGTDVASIKTIVENKGGNNPNPAPNPKGAAGENDPQNPKGGKQETMQIPKELLDHPGIKQLVEEHEATKKSLDEIKKERDEEKKKIAEQKRKSAAESIVTLLIKHKKIEEKSKDSEIKKYLDLKNEDGTPVDLDAIEATLKSVLGTEEPAQQPTVKGAYGAYTIPNLAGDKTGKHRSNAEILGV